MEKGRLIAIEGADGAGTTTISRMLQEEMSRLPEFDGVKIALTAEPSHGPVGTMIRKMLGGDYREVPNKAMELMFRADRVDHDRTIIRKYLDRGDWVITDRHYPSTLVYQTVPKLSWDEKPFGTVSGALSLMTKMFRSFCDDDGIRIPDLTIYLAADQEVLKRRRESRGGKREIFETDEYQSKVVVLYDLWSKPFRFMGEEGQWKKETVDASRPVEDVLKSCLNIVREFY